MKSQRQRAIDTIRQAGIVNPLRLVKLMRDTITFLHLDLSGLTVLTEAASGPYVVTPVLASLAGAERVIALTRDSRFASNESVIRQTRALEELCEAERQIKICAGRPIESFREADIVTNLGFVRPIDAQAVALMKTTAVVPLMCESWEFRPGDVDLEACDSKGIMVLGTNEDYPGLEIFDYSGWLCLKMLFEAQIEPHRCKIVIIGSDNFGQTIKRRLDSCAVSSVLLPKLSQVDCKEALPTADALLVADYTRKEVIVGPGGDIDAAELSRLAPAITVLQFAGVVDTKNLRENNITFHPKRNPGYRRMGQTLSEVGPKPVIELHAAGLKVGQAASTARLRGAGVEEAVAYALSNSPARPIS